MSRLFIENGWNLNCLVPEYRNLDYRDPQVHISHSDIRFAKMVLGRDLTPYEVIFVKSSNGDPTNQIQSLTDLFLNQELNRFVYTTIRYGISEQQSIDVTKMIQTTSLINTTQLQPNTMFTDPYPEKPKALYIYVDQLSKPFVVHELENHFVDSCVYQFDNRNGRHWVKKL